MSNTITIELCAEDRARLDRLAEALEKRNCDQCVETALKFSTLRIAPTTETDPIQEKLAETLAKASETVEAPKNATEEQEPSTLTTAPPEEEKPTQEEPAQPEPTKTVSRDELKAKVVKLCAKGLKEQTRDVVKAYAETVRDIPEEKLAECYEKLEALEG